MSCLAPELPPELDLPSALPTPGQASFWGTTLGTERCRAASLAPTQLMPGLLSVTTTDVLRYDPVYSGGRTTLVRPPWSRVWKVKCLPAEGCPPPLDTSTLHNRHSLASITLPPCCTILIPHLWPRVSAGWEWAGGHLGPGGRQG